MSKFTSYIRQQFFTDTLISLLINPSFFIRGLLYKMIKKISTDYISGGILMDFGCGTQPYRHLFAVDEYIGVEYTCSRIDKSNFTNIIYYDGQSIPIKNETLDYVLSSEVFELIDQPDHILQELRRILKQGGILILTVPFVWPEHFLPYDHARYTLNGLSKIVSRNGFDIILASKTGNYTITLYQLLINGLYIYFSKFKIVKFLYLLTLQPLLNIFGLALWKLSKLKKKSNSESLYLNALLVCKKISG